MWDAAQMAVWLEIVMAGFKALTRAACLIHMLDIAKVQDQTGIMQASEKAMDLVLHSAEQMDGEDVAENNNNINNNNALKN